MLCLSLEPCNDYLQSVDVHISINIKGVLLPNVSVIVVFYTLKVSESRLSELDVWSSDLSAETRN
jgi:hypothetical protein